MYVLEYLEPTFSVPFSNNVFVWGGCRFVVVV